ncbi:hypothetical protein ACSBR1_036802 [Camellia fascicularis]
MAASNQTILVTGSARFIGTHTALQLLKQGFKVAIIDNVDNSVGEAVDRVRDWVEPQLSNNLDFHLGDLRNKEDLEKLFSQTKEVSLAIIYLSKEGKECVVGIIFECLTMKLPSVLVFSPSLTVYGQPEKIPCVEDFELIPMNPYGRTKLFLGEIARDIQSSDPEWRVIFLRYFNPVGAHESGKIGEDPKGIPNNLMPYIQQVAVGRLPELNVYGRDYPTPDAHPSQPNQIVLGMSDGAVYVIKPFDAEQNWGRIMSL